MHQHGRQRLLVFIGLVAVTALLGASVAAAAPPQGVSMEGTGPAPAGSGQFSKAALAQENCADNGRTPLYYEGGGPWCVNPWPAGKDNGGATAPGVTADAITVVAYMPNAQMIAAIPSGKPVNNATKQVPASIDDVIRDTQTAYEATVKQHGSYQLWGRKLSFDVVTASGSDEAAQRADAIEVLAKKPFIVLDANNAEAFSSAVAAKKVIVISGSTDAQSAAAQSPYRYNFGADPSAAEALAGVFVGKSLSAKPAKWAGDDALKTETRSVGLVYPTTGFDADSFERYLKQNGGKLSDKASYDSADSAAAQATLPTIVSRFKSQGVTSVVLAAAPGIVQSLMKVATEQDYHPEWIYTGFMYQEFDALARGNDQTQMAHAFGMATLGPYASGTRPPLTVVSWYWGPNAGNVYGPMNAQFQSLYQGVHYAGPTLTAQNFQKGLYAAPAITPGMPSVTTGAAGYGKTVGLPYDEFALFGSDRSLVWWDSAQTGPGQVSGTVGQGVMMYLNQGAASKYSDFTKTTPKFFDPSASVVQVDSGTQYPGGTVPASLSCSGCPSGGLGTGTTS